MIDRFTELSAQTFQSLIVIYRRVNFYIIIGDLHQFIGNCLIPLDPWLAGRFLCYSVSMDVEYTWILGQGKNFVNLGCYFPYNLFIIGQFVYPVEGKGMGYGGGGIFSLLILITQGVREGTMGN